MLLDMETPIHVNVGISPSQFFGEERGNSSVIHTQVEPETIQGSTYWLRYFSVDSRNISADDIETFG